MLGSVPKNSGDASWPESLGAWPAAMHQSLDDCVAAPLPERMSHRCLRRRTARHDEGNTMRASRRTKRGSMFSGKYAQKKDGPRANRDAGQERGFS